MIVTEKRAAEMWCPMVRAANGRQASNCTINTTEEVNAARGQASNAIGATCIGRKCMMWRVVQRIDGAFGYCGLAGKPE